MRDQPPLPEPPPSAEPPGRAGVAADAPERPRRWPILVAAMVMGLVLIGVTALMAWAFAGPVRCPDGSFASTRFGYCVTVPEGWNTLASQNDDRPFDLFQAEAAGASITVSAVGLDRGEDLAAFAGTVQALDASVGYESGDPVEIEVAGEPALRFDLAPTPDAGADPTRGREVVFIHDGVGWRVQMGDTPRRFDDTAAALDGLLAGWVFV